MGARPDEVVRVSDLVTFGETMLRFTPPGHERLESAATLDVRAAGAESNVAVAADRLGATASWISKLPRNSLGRRIVGELQGYGIDTSVAWSEGGRVGTYFTENAGQPRGTKTIYDRENAAIATARAEELDLDLVRRARVFFTSGITPALSEPLRETTFNLLKTAREAGTTTAMDVNYRAQLWSPQEAREVLTRLFPGIDVLVIANRDADRILGFEGSPNQLAHKLASEFDFTTVIVTRGDRGALAWHDNTVYHQDPFKTDTYDPIGSGDAFTGAFIARRVSGDDVQTALSYAAATAALKRTIPGDVALVTRQEVERVRQGRPAGDEK